MQKNYRFNPLPAPRATIPLNGTWRCMPDAADQGRKLGYHRVAFEFMDRVGSGYGARMWRKASVPCCYSHSGLDLHHLVKPGK